MVGADVFFGDFKGFLSDDNGSVLSACNAADARPLIQTV